jgi:uncharacterized protein YkwD
MKRHKKLLKNLFIPHRSNSYRPHALRHKVLSVYSLGLIFTHMLLGATLYSGPITADTKAIAKNIVTQSNMERKKTKAPELYESLILEKAAQEKLNDMFQKNYWDHYGPNGETAWDFIDNNGYSYHLAGENLARGFINSQEVVSAWMNSPSHRANILNDRFREIGVAVGSGKIKGQATTVIVQLFGEPKIAVAAEKSLNTNSEASIMPILSAEMATSPGRAVYWAAWLLIFALVLLDGLMIRKLGLHCSRSHRFNFRVSLLMSVIGLALLMFGFVAIL